MSDSHSALSFMRLCVESLKPDAIIHLGDYVHDGDALREEYPDIPFYQVAGNCDRNRVPQDFPEVRLEHFLGLPIYFTHGHLHGVKLYNSKLVAEAQKCGARVVLYGHTHCAECYQTESGMWVMNPGSCGYYGGSVGLIQIDTERVVSCRIIYQADLEAYQL